MTQGRPMPWTCCSMVPHASAAARLRCFIGLDAIAFWEQEGAGR